VTRLNYILREFDALSAVKHSLKERPKGKELSVIFGHITDSFAHVPCCTKGRIFRAVPNFNACIGSRRIEEHDEQKDGRTMSWRRIRRSRRMSVRIKKELVKVK
jgi:hypothetical protein